MKYGDYNCIFVYLGVCGKRKKRSVDSSQILSAQETFNKLNQGSNSQDELFDLIRGQNMGEILWKAWRNETLTMEEKQVFPSKIILQIYFLFLVFQYLDAWTTQKATDLAAFAIYCNEVGPNGIQGVIEKVDNVLKNVRKALT